jgi:hypothetical protein
MVSFLIIILGELKYFHGTKFYAKATAFASFYKETDSSL